MQCLEKLKLHMHVLIMYDIPTYQCYYLSGVAHPTNVLVRCSYKFPVYTRNYTLSYLRFHFEASSVFSQVALLKFLKINLEVLTPKIRV